MQAPTVGPVIDYDVHRPPRPAAARRLRTAPPVDGSRARRDAGVRLWSLVALWSSLLLVAYWWATGGGIQDLGGWDDGADCPPAG